MESGDQHEVATLCTRHHLYDDASVTSVPVWTS